MVDFALQRLNMVESQIRPSDLTDRRVASAMSKVMREAFLPDALQSVAYGDGELSLDAVAATPRSMLAPRTVAKMIQALELDANDVVLLVGIGCGYEAALLSQIAQTVVGLDADQSLAAWSEKVLREQDISNAAVVQGALQDGVAGEGPFDAIFINGGVDDVPDALLDQLKDGGKMVAIHRSGGVMRLSRWQRSGEGFSMTDKGDAAAQVLPSFAKEPSFVF